MDGLTLASLCNRCSRARWGVVRRIGDTAQGEVESTGARSTSQFFYPSWISIGLRCRASSEMKGGASVGHRQAVDHLNVGDHVLVPLYVVAYLVGRKIAKTRKEPGLVVDK